MLEYPGSVFFDAVTDSLSSRKPSGSALWDATAIRSLPCAGEASLLDGAGLTFLRVFEVESLFDASAGRLFSCFVVVLWSSRLFLVFSSHFLKTFSMSAHLYAECWAAL